MQLGNNTYLLREFAYIQYYLESKPADEGVQISMLKI